MKLFLNTTSLSHELKQLASDTMNMTASFVTLTLKEGSKWMGVTKDETITWVNDRAEVAKVFIQHGLQSIVAHTKVLWRWSKVGFAAGAFALVIFGAIYVYLYIGRLFFFLRLRRK
jgi:hypothetical protein